MRWFFLIPLSFLLVACQTYDHKKDNQLLQQKVICCADISQLPYQTLKHEEALDISLDKDAPVFKFKAGKRYFAAYQLPEWRGPLQLNFVSRSGPGGGQVGVVKPVIEMLDAAYQPTRTVTPNMEKHWYGNRFEFTIFINREDAAERYFVVYPEMSDAQLGDIDRSYSPIQVGHGVLLVPVTVGGHAHDTLYRSAVQGKARLRIRPYGWQVNQ